jgi:hypothetical protein
MERIALGQQCRCPTLATLRERRLLADFVAKVGCDRRPSFRIRFKCANRISIFLRSRRDCSKASVSARERATSREAEVEMTANVLSRIFTKLEGLQRAVVPVEGELKAKGK